MTTNLVKTLERESMALLRAIDNDQLIACVIAGTATRGEYVRFLESTYHYLRWSGPLLARTVAGLRKIGRYPWLFDIVDAKTREEASHDGWVLRDLANLGVDVELVKGSPIPSAIHAYIQWGLTMADSGSPAYLGTAFALEFIAAERATTAACNLRHRKTIPCIEASLSFLDGHGEADTGHIAELTDVLHRIEEPADHDAIALSAAVTRTLYPRFFYGQVVA